MREIFNMDYDWKFHKGDVVVPITNAHNQIYAISKASGAIGPPRQGFNDTEWETVNLPHDWAVENELDKEMRANHGYKDTGIGWYRKRFFLEEADSTKHLLLYFGGISTACVIYFNGTIVKRNQSGYNSFSVDLTDLAYFGLKPNTIAIKVDCTQWEGWWYEGAGIYRHTKLIKKDMLHIANWGVKALPKKLNEQDWDTNVEVKIENGSYEKKSFTLLAEVSNKNGAVVSVYDVMCECDGLCSITVPCNLPVQNPSLWDIDSPELYTLKVSVLSDGKTVDSESKNIGYRTIESDPDKGFFLNGKNVKLKGTCNHQDHAGVGVALPDSVHEYRIKKLKEMGSNCYRCAHNNPAEEILDACDRLGMLVMDENRNFNTSDEVLEQLECMVKRDCNHPSVIMYSVANEEPLQATTQGTRLAKHMEHRIKAIDNTRPVLAALNGGIMAAEGIALACDIAGINYQTYAFDDFHEAFPNQPMVSSESVSAFSVRGEYATDNQTQVITSYDETAAPWGDTVRNTWKAVNERDFVMGMFTWTGFDYRGEPTPFTWPSHSTFFGAMDTCAFPKESFYLHKALWVDNEPTLHIMPHWNWKKGDKVKLMTYTNCEEAELFLNGISLGKKTVDRYEQPEWCVMFEEGALSAKGFIGGKEVISDEVKTAGAPKKLVLTADKATAKAASQDCVIINIYAVDDKGILVPYANEYVSFEVNSDAKILGVGNGDPNCHEPDKACGRSLFHGCCQMLLGIGDNIGDITVKASAKGLESSEAKLAAVKADFIPKINNIHETYLSDWYMTEKLFDEFPDANMKRADSDMNTWEPVIISDRVQSKFMGQVSKYAIYRTSFENKADGDITLHFYKLTGYAHIYANGRLICEKDCVWGDECDVAIPNIASGNVEISIVLQSKIPDNVAGITIGVTMRAD